MKLDASHIRYENTDGAWSVDPFGERPWSDELTFGIIEVEDWDDAVERILEDNIGGAFDYGKTNMRVERGGKIILINVDTKERRIIECGC